MNYYNLKSFFKNACYILNITVKKLNQVYLHILFSYSLTHLVLVRNVRNWGSGPVLAAGLPFRCDADQPGDGAPHDGAHAPHWIWGMSK